MKVLIVGGVAGGASTAARLRRLDENAQIIIFERGANISFANCGIPYFVGDVIKEREKLLVMTPEKIKSLLNIEARVQSEVISINRENKTVRVFDKIQNREYEESYDKLVLSPGASPVIPPIEGIKDERIFTVRNLEDADRIKHYISSEKPQKAVVIGGGFIGIEIAENLLELGIQTSIIEMADQLLGQIDYEMAAQVQNHIRDKGVSLHFGDGVKLFKNSEENINVVLHSGKQIEADFVVLSIGVKPETTLVRNAGIELGSTGGILVNEHMQTSDADIFALGDAVEIKDFVSETKALIPLAGPANRQGRIVAENIAGQKSKYKSTLGTAIVKVFDMTVASAGNSEKILKRNNVAYLKSYTQGFSHADYYPEPFPLMIKLLFSPDNGKILGAQVVGLDGVDKRIDVLASAIQFEKTVYDLKELELAYAPPFGSAKDPVNIAGMVAENILNGLAKPLYWSEVDNLLNDENAVFVDVRSKEEQLLGKLENSINIPIEELRSRTEEIPHDKRVVLYCTKGLKSYFASRILLQKGFDNVFTLNGGYSLYKQVVLNKQGNLSVNNISAKHLQPEQAYSKSFEIDACGLQCPGPIMKLSDALKNIENGEVVEIKTTDPGFKRDIDSWCKSTGNTLLSVKEENRIIKASVQKSLNISENKQDNVKNKKTLVVFSNDLDKALASFIIANGAAATGSEVTMFFTFWGLNILRKPEKTKVKKGLIDKMFAMMMPKGANALTLSKMHFGGLGTLMMKHVMKSKNVATLSELVAQAQANGVKLLACQMAMDVMGLKPEELIDGVEIAGVATFLNDAEQSNTNLFI